MSDPKKQNQTTVPAPKQIPQTTKASKESNNVFKVSIKEVKKYGA
jgi:hypothetical protein